MSPRTQALREFLGNIGSKTFALIELSPTKFGKVFHGMFAVIAVGLLCVTFVNIAQQYRRYETDTYVEVKLSILALNECKCNLNITDD